MSEEIIIKAIMVLAGIIFLLLAVKILSDRDAKRELLEFIDKHVPHDNKALFQKALNVGLRKAAKEIRKIF